MLVRVYRRRRKGEMKGKIGNQVVAVREGEKGMDEGSA